MAKIFVRANSHRAYERLFRLVGGKENAPAHYIVTHRLGDNSKGYYLIEESYLEKALKIKGITKPKNQDESTYGLCWSWE